MIVNMQRKKERNKRYYQKHKEEYRQKAKVYRLLNKNKIAEGQKDWYKRNKNKSIYSTWKNRILRDYGCSVEQYNKMLEEQDNKCAICKSDNLMHRTKWHVDHCHETGKIRGLLCTLCNVGLGSFKDNKEFLKCAIEYLDGSNING